MGKKINAEEIKRLSKIQQNPKPEEIIKAGI